MPRTWRRTTAAVALAAALVLPALPPVAASAGEAWSGPPTTTKCATDVITPGVKPRAEYVSQRLRAAGFSPAATAGVLGNLDFLSAITPTATAPGRTGLALWPTDSWQRYVAGTKTSGAHRWAMGSQTTFLIQQLSALPARLRTMTDPVKAAAAFHTAAFPSQASAAQVRATRGAKATGWAQQLAGRPAVAAPSDNRTYGLVVDCEPVGATLEACPVVPRPFKQAWSGYTGFRWGDMSPESKLVSRCVYANFPRITLHGTYAPGHMPSWDRAIDFMMPASCSTEGGRSWTNSGADLLLGTRLAQYLLRRAERLSIDYVIWQDHVRNPGSYYVEDSYAPVADWRQDNYNNGDCTNTHFDHVHMSVND